jgi:trigger factor
MDIKKEEKSGLVQELIIEITKDDYAEKVEQALKKQRREVQIPGFRAGFAPMGLIKKMYEKHMIAEEVNSMVGEALYGYLEDNEIDFMLEPLAINEKSVVDFENPDKFTFVFEYAPQPQFDLNLSELPEINDFYITASQELVDEYINNLRRKYGKFINPETVSEADYLSVKYGKDNALYSSLLMSELSEEGKKEFIGKKVDDVVTVSLKAIFDKPAAIAKFFKIKEEEIEVENAYTENITIVVISRLEEAELNEAFYGKIYPDGSINSEEGLQKAAVAAIEAEWEKESDRYFMNNAITTLMSNVHIELPDDFIKRYILHNSKEINAEMLDEKYDGYQQSFKWQLVENKILTENNINITEEDIKAYVRQFFVKNYFANFNQEEIQDRLDTLVKDAMKNKEDVRNIYDQLVESKMKEVFKTQMKVNTKTGDVKAFIEEIGGGKGEKTTTKKAKAKKATSEATPDTASPEAEPEAKTKVAAKKPKTEVKSKAKPKDS